MVWPRAPSAPPPPGDQQIGVPQRRAGAWLPFENLKSLEKVFRDVQPILGHSLLENGQDLMIKRAPGSHVHPTLPTEAMMDLAIRARSSAL
jgi:hypothetical protein